MSQDFTPKRKSSIMGEVAGTPIVERRSEPRDERIERIVARIRAYKYTDIINVEKKGKLEINFAGENIKISHTIIEE